MARRRGREVLETVEKTKRATGQIGSIGLVAKEIAKVHDLSEEQRLAVIADMLGNFELVKGVGNRAKVIKNPLNEKP